MRPAIDELQNAWYKLRKRNDFWILVNISQRRNELLRVFGRYGKTEIILKIHQLTEV